MLGLPVPPELELDDDDDRLVTELDVEREPVVVDVPVELPALRKINTAAPPMITIMITMIRIGIVPIPIDRRERFMMDSQRRIWRIYLERRQPA
jgi:hypothetical protein